MFHVFPTSGEALSRPQPAIVHALQQHATPRTTILTGEHHMRAQRQRRVGPDVQSRRQKTPPVNIDPVLFWNTFRESATGINLYELANELDITASTFTRIKYAAENIDPKYRPNLPTFLTLCRWMGTNPEEFIVGPHKFALKPAIKKVAPPESTP